MSKSATFKFIAQVKFIPINMGFWGLVAEDGAAWRSNNMPDVLKKENIWVAIEAQLSENQFSIFMWGQAIDILNFKIIKE